MRARARVLCAREPMLAGGCGVCVWGGGAPGLGGTGSCAVKNDATPCTFPGSVHATVTELGARLVAWACGRRLVLGRHATGEHSAHLRPDNADIHSPAGPRLSTSATIRPPTTNASPTHEMATTTPFVREPPRWSASSAALREMAVAIDTAARHRAAPTAVHASATATASAVRAHTARHSTCTRAAC